MKKGKPFPKARAYTDARGKTRWRMSVKGIRTDLGAEWGSEEFKNRYDNALVGGKGGMIGASRTKRNSVSDLVARFYKSRVYKGWSDSTKATNRAIIEKWRDEYGIYSVATLKKHNIDAMMAAKSDTPAAANNFLKRINQVLDLAVDLKMAPANEARKVKFFEYESEGIYTWTEDDITAYYKCHKPGSVAHDAMTLMLYTAAAKVDAVQMGRFSIKAADDGPRLIYRRQKMRNRKPMRVSIRIHEDLAPVLDRLTNKGTFLETRQGKERSRKGLGGAMRKWCDDAGLPHCTAHGLRKACARRLAEGGASAPQIMAITGHKTLSEVQRYIDAANREDMADDGMAVMVTRPNGEQTVANTVELFATLQSNN
ncbi:MAG: tyrosine-type recombinase/integrase [Sulfitobacter sp.]